VVVKGGWVWETGEVWAPVVPFLNEWHVAAGPVVVSAASDPNTCVASTFGTLVTATALAFPATAG
jgi:hypothetical protein